MIWFPEEMFIAVPSMHSSKRSTSWAHPNWTIGILTSLYGRPIAHRNTKRWA